MHTYVVMCNYVCSNILYYVRMCVHMYVCNNLLYVALWDYNFKYTV